MEPQKSYFFKGLATKVGGEGYGNGHKEKELFLKL